MPAALDAVHLHLIDDTVLKTDIPHTITRLIANYIKGGYSTLY